MFDPPKKDKEGNLMTPVGAWWLLCGGWSATHSPKKILLWPNFRHIHKTLSRVPLFQNMWEYLDIYTKKPMCLITLVWTERCGKSQSLATCFHSSESERFSSSDEVGLESESSAAFSRRRFHFSLRLVNFRSQRAAWSPHSKLNFGFGNFRAVWSSCLFMTELGWPLSGFVWSQFLFEKYPRRQVQSSIFSCRNCATEPGSLMLWGQKKTMSRITRCVPFGSTLRGSKQ